jgi:hypothetical protein
VISWRCKGDSVVAGPQLRHWLVAREQAGSRVRLGVAAVDTAPHSADSTFRSAFNLGLLL